MFSAFTTQHSEPYKSSESMRPGKSDATTDARNHRALPSNEKERGSCSMVTQATLNTEPTGSVTPSCVAHRQGGVWHEAGFVDKFWSGALRAHGSFPGFVRETPRRGRQKRKARSRRFCQCILYIKVIRWPGFVLSPTFWRKQSTMSGFVHLRGATENPLVSGSEEH